MEAMLRTIREKEPIRPSARISTLAAAEQTTVAQQRQTEVPKLINLVRGDLDWIVMKCLEKDRARRYETASSLALDIQRHLSEEPVSAVAPGIGYRLGKFVRRNKTALSVTAALAILSGALLISMILLFNEWHAGKLSGINLNSNPEGAEVWRDGRRIGTTPLQMAGVPTGDFTFSLVLANYESFTNTTVMVPRKQMSHFTFLRRLQIAGTNAVSGGNTNLQELVASVPQSVVVLSIQGFVEVAKKGSPEWKLAQTNMVLHMGDQVRTGAKSGATLRLSDLNVVRISELTQLEIQTSDTNKLEKPTLQLKKGLIDFFHRERSSNSPPITTPAARVGIQG